MSEIRRPTIVTWQTGKHPGRLVFENALLEAKRSGLLDPFVIECGMRIGAEDKASAQGKPDLASFMKRDAGQIPQMRLEGFLSFAAELGRRKQVKLLGGMDFFVLTEPGAMKRVSKLSACLWVFLSPNSMSASFLYHVLSCYEGEEGLGPTIHLWYVDIEEVERAAREHLRILDELKRLGMEGDSIFFAGNSAVDDAKSRLAQECDLPLIELFRGDAFHGSIKSSLQRAAMRGDGGSFQDVQGLRKALLALGENE